MKYLPTIAGIILGLLFLMASVPVLLHAAPEPKIPEGTPMYLFMGAFGPTGYFTFVKVLELLGGILVGIPRTRNFGLLILGPIIVNILAFHIFIMKGASLTDPMAAVMTGCVCLLALYLLWVARKQFAALAN
jgi:hypothetical protein